MKLTKLANGELTQTKEVPGLLSCRLDYEIKSGQGRLQYTGPKFSRELWHQVLSFFRWTYKEMDSESQVRLYVNTKLGRWGAWAFPQEARTGLNAREIATLETPEQAAERFASWNSTPSADWLYFCTVHHHCAASAFQSGTDEANEQNQDGLHITVGRMDAERHELHARFYLAGNCFEPDLSRFWPIEAELAQQVPTTLHDALARFQMGEKVVVDFPEAWRKNVIETPRETRPIKRSSTYPETDRLLFDTPDWVRANDALRDMERGGFTEDDLIATIHSLAEDPVVNLILAACLKHQVTPEAILEEVQSYQSGF